MGSCLPALAVPLPVPSAAFFFLLPVAHCLMPTCCPFSVASRCGVFLLGGGSELGSAGCTTGAGGLASTCQPLPCSELDGAPLALLGIRDIKQLLHVLSLQRDGLALVGKPLVLEVARDNEARTGDSVPRVPRQN